MKIEYLPKLAVLLTYGSTVFDNYFYKFSYAEEAVLIYLIHSSAGSFGICVCDSNGIFCWEPMLPRLDRLDCCTSIFGIS